MTSWVPDGSRGRGRLLHAIGWCLAQAELAQWECASDGDSLGECMARLVLEHLRRAAEEAEAERVLREGQ